ncbi:sensor domain-containing diguanylate cyclase [Raoultibacter phocaeensis]|uniref:sensor domain-containing diguanylate cyclase n=1 Tax=Raoultibacter phocaeensis TaxID=2479841 RepID=UPI00111A7705|nr:sensor domain-containing diguanylate cyclase [Raoultibacter phocaeensis]
MGKSTLARTNVLVCLVVATGFLLVAFLGYRANYSSSAQDIENLSLLVSEDIFHQQSAIFAKPVMASRTMAGDVFLAELLERGVETGEDGDFTEEVVGYLEAYHKAFGYESVFLVSAATARYYSYAGYDRTLVEGDPENGWYFEAIESTEDYLLEVDNDQVTNDEITVFVNCRVLSEEGDLLGIVGVGVRTSELQAVLADYAETFDADVYFVSEDGTIQLSRDHVGYDEANLFDVYPYGDDVRECVLSLGEDETPKGFWIDSAEGVAVDSYMVVRTVPDLDWNLVVERDTGELLAGLQQRFFESMLIIVVVIVAILGIITQTIRAFNRRIVEVTRMAEAERRTAFERATEDLFEHIYELDITNNCSANDATERYFESLGAPKGTPFDKALEIVAEKQIKEEFRQGYIDTFRPSSVMKAFSEGREMLQYEFLMADKAGEYYWMRITARIVKLESEGTVHMLSYRQNIDAEKRQERKMIERAETDEMTGFASKGATARYIEALLSEKLDRRFALFMIDIDDFKQANDAHGHQFGDEVIVAFCDILREQFGKGAVLGRVGGDEFTAFVEIPKEAWAKAKASTLIRALDATCETEGIAWKMSASAGVAVYPDDGGDFATLIGNADTALYHAKKLGKNCFVVFGDLRAEGTVQGVDRRCGNAGYGADRVMRVSSRGESAISDKDVSD